MNEILNSVCAANFTFCHRVVINLLTNYFHFAPPLKQCVCATLEKWSDLGAVVDAEGRSFGHRSLARSAVVRKVRHSKSKRIP